MPRPPGHLVLPVEVPVGGLNRLPGATARQAAEALNVTADDGDLRRRDGFASIAMAPPFYLPYGQVQLQIQALLGGFINRREVDGFPGGEIEASTEFVYVGNTINPFDGFEWGPVTLSGTWTRSMRIVVSYWNGADWTELPWVFDDTLEIRNSYIQPLAKSGRVGWHRTDVADWAQNTVNTVSAYWVRIGFERLAGFSSSTETPRIIQEPGIRTFLLEPVNGLLPLKIDQQAALLIGSDRAVRRGVELGANLGVKVEKFEKTRLLMCAIDEGMFVSSTFNYADGWNGAPAGAGPTVTLDLYRMKSQYLDPDTNSYRDFNWLADQFLGGLIELAALATNVVDENLVDGVADAARRGHFEHCRLTWLDAPSDPETREVYDSGLSDQTRLRLYPDFSGIPVSGVDEFNLRLPGCAVRFPDLHGDEDWEVASNNAREIALVQTVLGYLDNTFPSVGGFRYQVVKEPRWCLEAGQRWSAITDPITGQVLAVNGGAIQETNGRVLRPLKADTTSISALRYSGALVDDQTTDAQSDPKAIALSKLRREPPKGKFLALYANRIFVAGIPGAPQTFYWSAPGALNNVWPFLFENAIRDSEADPITGMVAAGDRLYIFTVSSIHALTDPNDLGWFGSQLVAQGLGFVSHQAVAVTNQQQVIGVGPDGIYGLSGGAVTQLLDRWDRLFRGGVNMQQLHKAVACYAPQANKAFFAVPAQGSSTNNRLIELDIDRQAWWVHELPFGCSSLSVDVSDVGQEMVLIGTDDGFVQTFKRQNLDDGRAVTGTITTQSVELLGGQQAKPTTVRVKAGVAGVAQALTLELLAGDSEAVWSGLLYFDASRATYGQEDYDALADSPNERSRYQDSREMRFTQNGIRSVNLHEVSVRMSGTHRFRVRSVELEAVQGVHRGRR